MAELLLPRLGIACSCSGIGIFGMCGFWYTWRENYIWINSKIFVYVFVDMYNAASFIKQLTFFVF
jgi:hypothetical protein